MNGHGVQAAIVRADYRSDRVSATLKVASLRSPLTVLNPPDFGRVHPDAVADVKASFAQTWKPDLTKGIVLTDDYNPVEYYDAANREKLRRQMAMSMRPG